MKKYETYKDSGIDWIGEIPERWKLNRLKDNAEIIMGQSPDSNSYNDEEIGLPFYQGKVDFGELNPIPRVWCNEPTKISEDGDILIAVRAPVGELNISNEKCCIGRGLTAVRIKKGYQKFAFYLFQIINEELRINVTGSTFEAVSSNDVSILKYVFPPIDEQLSIANYLDDQTQKIDRLLSNKKTQAEKLKELRQIEINNAVTKGLNPNAEMPASSVVEMKDSGIEWLGKIPRHWEKRKIATNFQIIGSGTTPDAGNEEYYDETGKYYFVNTGDLKDCEIYDCEKKITEEAFIKFTSLKLFPVNTLLIAMYGATIGKVGILKTEATTNQACCALANSYRFNIDYMFYFFIGIREDIIRLSYGGGQPNISQDTIKQLRIPCPPKDEQLQIVEHLKKRTKAIDQLIKNIEAQIEKLQELRKIKIYEAVTGKIKVKEDE